MELQLGLALRTMPFAMKAPLLDLNTTDEQSDASSYHDEELTDQSDSNSTNQTLTLFFCNKDEDETEGVVGWPPINSSRRRQRGGGGGLIVKAQMEGVLITRKIDLNLHQSYHTLLSTLLFMFGRGQESVNLYTLTYQDMEGDWLLAHDVPWRFLTLVQRLGDSLTTLTSRVQAAWVALPTNNF